ncbi:MAG: FecR domain-containing protein [Betaproteobacteria bacterium]|nr:FecR domain-containing protein [Betaproteobacteria bacterium]
MRTAKLLSIFLGLALLTLAELVFAQAATVYELIGSAKAIPNAGAPRDLRKGDTVNQGDTIVTDKETSLVLGFQDGHTVIMPGESRLAITAYQYNRDDPSKSNVLLSLLDGGMRAISGLIGKARPQQVSYRAGNATIGIRGTIVNTAIRNKVTTATVEIEKGPDGKSVATSIVVSFGDNRTVTVPAGAGFFVDSAGQVQVRPADEVIKSLGETPLAYIIRAVLNTAAKSEIQRALTQAFKDSGATGVKPPSTTTTPSSTGNSGSSGASGSGGGSASGR